MQSYVPYVGKFWRDKILANHYWWSKWRGKFWRICWQVFSYFTVFITIGAENFGELYTICQIRQHFPPPNFSHVRYVEQSNEHGVCYNITGKDTFDGSFVNTWEVLTKDKWISNSLCRPTSSRKEASSAILSNRAIGEDIASLLEKGAISAVDKSFSQEGFYSILFLVPKKNGKMRPVITWNWKPSISGWRPLISKWRA